VAKAAQTLGYDHFFAGRPADNDYARRVAEMNAAENEATETNEDELPDRHPDEYRSTQDPLYRWNYEDIAAHAAGAVRRDEAPPAEDGLQIVADSDDGGRRTEVG
jgi:hypothetical protein